MKNISSLLTCLSIILWLMPLATGNITLSTQRFPHLISGLAVYDKSVMEGFDARLPCGDHLPLWPSTINGLLSQEGESNCSFCRYSTLWPSHYLIIYMSSGSGGLFLCMAQWLNMTENLKPTPSSLLRDVFGNVQNLFSFSVFQTIRESKGYPTTIACAESDGWFCCDVVTVEAVGAGRMPECTMWSWGVIDLLCCLFSVSQQYFWITLRCTNPWSTCWIITCNSAVDS